MTVNQPKLSFGRIALYSMASAGLNILSITVGTWLLYFYAPPPDSGRTQYLPVALVGILLTITSIWDAAIDPFIGHWSDTLRSRWGRRRPFLIFAAPVVAIAAILIWTPPGGGRVVLNAVYFVLIAILYFSAFSLVGIPYDGTLPEMAPDSKTRVGLSYWKNVFGILGVLIGSIIAAPLFQNLGPVAMGAAVGGVALVTIWLTLLGLRETYAIVLSAAVVNVFAKSKAFDYRAFWVESMCCAAATRIIAKASGRRRQVGVFSGGLLHDIGRLALSEVVPEVYAKIEPNLDEQALIAAEENLIGLSHTEAGYLLAAHWGLPIEIAEPIRFHHRPDLAVDAKENVAIVSIATYMARTLGNTLDDNRPLLEALQVPLSMLGLDQEAAEAMLDEYLNLREDCLRDSLL